MATTDAKPAFRLPWGTDRNESEARAETNGVAPTSEALTTDQEIEQDVRRLVDQWDQIDALAKRSQAATLLYREPDMAVLEEMAKDLASYGTEVVGPPGGPPPQG